MKDKICKEDERKYYRFRETEFYGGCATADVVGCNLNCAYCFVNKPRKNPERIGKFYRPSEVVEELINLDQDRWRITGGEPTLSKPHLKAILDGLPSNKLFILETNGLLLGKDPEYAREVSRSNVLVRISLKGVDPSSFSKITGADPGFFKYQLKAIKNLKEAESNYRVAIIPKLYEKRKFKELLKRVVSIDSKLANKIEFESLKKYPHVEKEMEARGVELKW